MTAKLYEKWYHESARLLDEMDSIRSATAVTDADVRRLHAIREELAGCKASYRADVVPSRFVVAREFGSKLNSSKSSLAMMTRGDDYDDDGFDDDPCASSSSTSSFRLSPVQKFVKKYFSPENGAVTSLLLFHGVGLGKTCTAISVAEAFADEDYKIRVYCPGQIIEQFRRQIFDTGKLVLTKGDEVDVDASAAGQCTGSRYVAGIHPNDLADPARAKHRIERAIKGRYEIQTFYGLHRACQDIRNDVASQGATDAQVELILAQRLREEFSNSMIIIDEVHKIRDSPDDPEKLSGEALMRIIRSAVNLRLLLLTATPMFDTAAEAVWIVNLLRANDCMPGISEKATPIEIAAAADGYVSYAPSGHEESPELFPRVDYPSSSSPKQQPVDGLVLTLSEAAGPQGRHLRDTVETNPTLMQFPANVYYPTENCSLHEAFEERTLPNGSVQLRYSPSVAAEHGHFLSEKKCALFSAKIATIVALIKRSSGLCYVYSTFVDHGLVPLAVALEHAGFRRAPPSPAIVDSDEKAPYAGHNYAILCGNPAYSDGFSDTVSKFTARGNSDGSAIKVLLGSGITSEGLDLKNIRQVHVLEPWWNLNKIKQTIGRAVRRCSHAALPPDERTVSVYLHAVVCPRGQTTTDTIDVVKYKVAAKKGSSIAAMEKLLKEVSVDACLYGQRCSRAGEKKDASSLPPNRKEDYDDYRDICLPILSRQLKAHSADGTRSVVPLSDLLKHFRRMEKLGLSVAEIEEILHRLAPAVTTFDYVRSARCFVLRSADAGSQIRERNGSWMFRPSVVKRKFFASKKVQESSSSSSMTDNDDDGGKGEGEGEGGVLLPAATIFESMRLLCIKLKTEMTSSFFDARQASLVIGKLSLVVLDHVIDTLGEAELHSLIVHFMKNDELRSSFETDVVRSMVSAGYLLRKEGEDEDEDDDDAKKKKKKLDYAFNYYNKTYMKLTNSELRKVDSFEFSTVILPRLKRQRQREEEEQGVASSARDRNLIGFMSFVGPHVPYEFKTAKISLDGMWTKGMVCASSIAIKERLVEIIASIPGSGVAMDHISLSNASKGMLCLMMELLLRRLGKPFFFRCGQALLTTDRRR